MTFGSGAGLVLLTTAIGGCAGAGLAAFLIKYLQISNFEGGSGYFAVYVTGFGIIGGFLVGLITALSMRSGFWVAQGYSAGIVVGLAVLAALLTITLNDNGPKLNGDSLVLEVELKFPRPYKPDNFSRSDYGSGFWLQRSPDQKDNDRLGGLTVPYAPEPDGQYLATGVADLFYTTSPRYVRFYVGHQTDLLVKVPLPRHPGAQFLQWSAWADTTAAGHQFRFRIHRDPEYRKSHPDRRAAFKEERSKQIAALPADGPLAQWLPFFEDDDQRPTYAEQWEHPEADAVNAHPNDLAPLLRSKDDAVLRRAVFAAHRLETIPPSLIEPLTAAGRHTLDLIRQAHASSLPNDPDLVAGKQAYTFFFYWSDAMTHAGDAAATAHRAILEEIAPAVQGAGDDSIQLIATQVAAELAKR